ncbi:hypothetical protein [Mesobacillus zeae]|nr:hypothetical protein [Mesobacillus zeae]
MTKEFDDVRLKSKGVHFMYPDEIAKELNLPLQEVAEIKDKLNNNP